MSWYWIISIVLAVALYVIVFIKKNGLINGNPMNTITYKGCLGLYVGIDKNKAIKQIKGLNLEITEDDTDDELRTKIGGSKSIEFAPNTFNNISIIRLTVNELNIVTFISVCFHSIDEDIEIVKRVVIREIKNRLGNDLFPESEKYFVWKNGGYQVSLFDESGYTDKGTFQINIHRV